MTKSLFNCVNRTSKVLVIGTEGISIRDLEREIGDFLIDNNLYENIVLTSYRDGSIVFSVSAIGTPKKELIQVSFLEEDDYKIKVENNQRNAKESEILASESHSIIILINLSNRRVYGGLNWQLEWYDRICSKVKIKPVFFFQNLDIFLSDISKEWCTKNNCDYRTFVYTFLFQKNVLPDFILENESDDFNVIINKVKDFVTKGNRKRRISEYFNDYLFFPSVTESNRTTHFIEIIIKEALSKNLFYSMSIN